jgi:hypothetical protein
LLCVIYREYVRILPPSFMRNGKKFCAHCRRSAKTYFGIKHFSFRFLPSGGSFASLTPSYSEFLKIPLFSSKRRTNLIIRLLSKKYFREVRNNFFPFLSLLVIITGKANRTQAGVCYRFLDEKRNHKKINVFLSGALFIIKKE